jgi:aminomethyltransferase
MPGRRTPLHLQHVAAGARVVDFAGWDMPLQYRSVKEEQEAVRTGVGLFDVSHMGRFEVGGPGAADFLQRLVTNDLSKLRPGRAQYNLLCRPDGGILDDLVVYRPDQERWLVVVNAANRDKDWSWLREHAAAGVELADRSEELSLLAVQGPGAERLLPATGLDLAGLPYFGVTTGVVAGVPMVLSRTGYTGEDGFELFVPSGRAAELWAAVVEAGASPCGLAARDVCRLEAGLRLYGTDMDERTNPYEAGLGWTVKLDKGDFVGREELRRVKADGPRRSLVGLAGAERVIPRHGSRVSLAGGDVGVVTSGTYSFWLRRGIAMAMLEAAAAGPVGSQVAVASRGGEGGAEIVALPFYRGSVRPAAARAQA